MTDQTETSSDDAGRVHRPVRTEHRPTRLIAVLVSCVVVVAACSVSKSDADGEPTTTANGTTAVDYAAKFADAPVHGVTDDTIRIGVAMIDYPRIKDEFGIDIGEGGDPLPEEVLPALVESVNADGGINGRQIEIVTSDFIPVGSDSSEESCRELTEDEEVFAVVGMYVEDNALCITETHQTPYFSGWGLTTERQERSKAPYIIAGSAEETLAADQMAMALDEGVFDDAKLAVYWDGEYPDSLIDDDVIATLEDGGVDVVSKAKQPSSDDQVKAGQDIDNILARFEADGADTVVFYSGMPVVIPALERSQWNPRVVFVNGQATGDLSSFGLENPDKLDGAISLMDSTPSSVMETDPAFLACLDTINEYSDLDLKPTDIVSPDEREGSKGAIAVPQVCQIFDVMVKVLDAAGDEPSASSMITGMAGLGSFSLPGIPDASLGPDKWDTGSVIELWDYDVDEKRFVRADETTAD